MYGERIWVKVDSYWNFEVVKTRYFGGERQTVHLHLYMFIVVTQRQRTYLCEPSIFTGLICFYTRFMHLRPRLCIDLNVLSCKFVRKCLRVYANMPCSSKCTRLYTRTRLLINVWIGKQTSHGTYDLA